MAKLNVLCHACGKAHVFDGLMGFREECEACSADLHVCLTCRFYDRYVENQCREEAADPVAVKDRRNLCEYWKPKATGEGERSAADEAKAKLAALFGEKGVGKGGDPGGQTGGGKGPEPRGADPAAEAKAKLDALFRKK